MTNVHVVSVRLECFLIIELKISLERYKGFFLFTCLAPRTFVSGRTKTLIKFVCKTASTSGVVRARIVSTHVLAKKERDKKELSRSV